MKKSNELSKISPHLIKQYNINNKTKYERIIIDAKNLIVSERIDLIAKIKYIKSKAFNYQTKYFYNLYKKTIESFSQGSYIEPGNAKKNSFLKYIKEFDKLILNIKENNFNSNKSLIPVGNNNAIIDGAHRLSIAYYFNQKVECLKFNDISVAYDYKYFKENLLEEEYLDYLTLEYCKLKQNISVILVKDFNNQDLINHINDNYKVIYEKNIFLNNNGLKNLLFQINEGTNPNEYLNTNKYNNNFKLLVIESTSVNKHIETFIKKFNSSILCFSKIHQKSIKILETLLNKNSIEFLFNTNISINLYNKINKIKDTIEKEGLNLDDFIFVDDIVMELYGLKKCSSIECLSYNNLKTNKNLLTITNHKSNYYNKNLDDLLYNPNNYFYYNSVKFLTLKNTKSNNLKDKISIHKTLLKSINLKSIFNRIKLKLKIKIRNFKTKLKKPIKLILKKLRILT